MEDLLKKVIFMQVVPLSSTLSRVTVDLLKINIFSRSPAQATVTMLLTNTMQMGTVDSMNYKPQ
jgi:hypothetical protein